MRKQHLMQMLLHNSLMKLVRNKVSVGSDVNLLMGCKLLIDGLVLSNPLSKVLINKQVCGLGTNVIQWRNVNLLYIAKH